MAQNRVSTRRRHRESDVVVLVNEYIDQEEASIDNEKWVLPGLAAVDEVYEALQL